MTTSLPARPTTLIEIEGLIGQDLGPTCWQDVTQADIDVFADLTRDHQWIHVDVKRAAASPFGSTVAHGLFSLSLGPGFCRELIVFDGFGHVLNYGYDKVRFIEPVLAGSRLRMRVTVSDVQAAPSGVNVHLLQTFESNRSDRPAAIAEAVWQLR